MKRKCFMAGLRLAVILILVIAPAVTDAQGETVANRGFEQMQDAKGIVATPTAGQPLPATRP